jgi:hypothetical protein
MKKSYLIILFSSTLINSSCGDPSHKVMKDVTEKLDFLNLSIGDILNASKVHLYLKSNPASTKESNDLFMKGVDAYKNKQLLDSAKYYFEHSIQQKPTPTAYYELGNVYKELKAYDQSLLSYQLAERLDFAPFSNLLYQIAGTYSQKGDYDLSAKYLEYALQAGFTNIDKVNTDKELEALRQKSNYKFNDAIKNGTKGMSNPETLFWLQFKRQFSPAKLPLTLNSSISTDELEKWGFISYDFERFIPQMRNARFSREVGESYYFAYNLGENESYTALVYVKLDHYSGEDAPKQFIISTFDSKGGLIDKIEAGNSKDTGDISTIVKFDTPGSFVTKIYRLEYEKDPNEFGYWDNKIKNKTYLTTYNYKIDNKGKIMVSEETKDLAGN